MKPITVPNLTGPLKYIVLFGLGWRLYKVIRFQQKSKNQNRKRFRLTIRKVSSKRRRNSKNQNRKNFRNAINSHNSSDETLGTNVYTSLYQNCSSVFTDGPGLKRDEEQIEKGRGGGYCKGEN